MKFCVNCANFALQDKLEHRPDLGMCTRIEGSKDPVTGLWEDGRRWQWAKVARTHLAPSGTSYCGPEGRYFVEKENSNV